MDSIPTLGSCGPPQHAVSDSSRTRIVVADDDPFMADLLATALRGLGQQDVVLTSDGRTALTVLEDGYQGTQIVFCDLLMPGMDGLQLLRHLGGHPRCAAVVLLSGEDPRILGSAKALASAHGVRVLGALTKPIGRDALAHAVAQLKRVASRPPPNHRLNSFRATAADLARGISMNELVVHYQPKVDLTDHQVRGVEALVRWQHPEFGLLPPGLFVPLAEETGLMDPLTHAVFERALSDLAAWHSAGRSLTVSLNATVDTLARLDLPEEVDALARRVGAPLDSVVIEVTESRLAIHLERVLETLARLRLKHVGIAIDDFGTGYSTMDQLRHFPFTELKVDRAFVRGANEDGTTRAILESSVNLARQLGMTSVAEGVETPGELEAVREAGCDEVQGYLFAKPMAEAQLLEWVEDWSREHLTTTRDRGDKG